MPTVKINVTGLALCFYRNSFWNVVFISDSDHKAHISVNNIDMGEMWRYKNDYYMDFRSSNFGQEPYDPFGDDFDLLFNMSETYAHGLDRVNRKSWLYIKDRAAKNKDLIWMRVPKAILDVWQRTENDYWVQEKQIDNDAPPIEIIGKVGREVLLSFSASDPVKIEFSHYPDGTPASDPLHDPPAIDLPTGVQTIDMRISNDCMGSCKYNDFKDLYDLVEERKPNPPGAPPLKPREFRAGQIKPRSINALHQLGDKKNDPRARATASGNCDPVGSDPPPGGP